MHKVNVLRGAADVLVVHGVLRIKSRKSPTTRQESVRNVIRGVRLKDEEYCDKEKQGKREI